MKWLIYDVACVAIGILCGVLVPKHINMTPVSMVPVSMILLTILQVFLFKDTQEEEGFSTAYGSNINAREHHTMTQYMRFSLMLSLPWQFAFVIFFSNPVKFLSCLWYIVFLVTGGIVFRVKHGKQIKHRHQAQHDELEEQSKREEMGKWR